MKKYYCNPVNINYRYQFNLDQRNHGELKICREAADPSMISYKGRYYIFASMTLGVWVSDDLANWENHRLPEELPLYDYAPDVRVVGDYVYFCASSRDHICDRYRTKDILNGPYEKLPGSFPFWDPNVFADDDGKIYFYWGCSNQTPIYGCELDPQTMNPKGETVELIHGDPFHNGFERVGENNAFLPAAPEEIEAAYTHFFTSQGMKEEDVPAELRPLIKGMFTRRPYIEGAWMDKHNGKYYLQYAFGGTQYNTYGDGVYISDHPLGPFYLAENAPYSYNPGGFIPGAGHGSTMEDASHNLWHAATMRISLNHDFERRVGIWRAGWDQDGELFCNQRYPDWPFAVTGEAMDPWEEPEWMLLSYGKKASASSQKEGSEADHVLDENVRTLWRPVTNRTDEWIMTDLEDVYEVHGIQINFGDLGIDIKPSGTIRGTSQARYIEESDLYTRWKLEGSKDGENWFVIEDKSKAETDLSHDLVIREEGIPVRYLRLSELAVPYDQIPAVSGIRVFGLGNGKTPAQTAFTAIRDNDLDLSVKIEKDDALGHVILWGSKPDHLYHSCIVYGRDGVDTPKRIGALVSDREYAIRVDGFNESGITEGICKIVK
ncbi:MAG: family 43 glycosylhydrolase [Lachnospiraceae bacterium]|nr:family 43 glycosylhydrolase [Lachnospiraceae bacterium]